MASTPTKNSIAGRGFRPAHLHLPTVRLFYACLPWILRRFHNIIEVETLPDDVARLQALRKERLMLTPNHPTDRDPCLLFALSKAADMPFHYLACREAFDPMYGLSGKLLQRLGAYSVQRGTADRESFRATRSLLASPSGKVVIFPEGEVHSQNDTLLPFHSGMVQLAFWALEDLNKAGEPEPNISLLPIALRYRFAEDMTQAIEESLRRLEETLKLSAAAGDAPYPRLRRIGMVMLEALEAEYGIKGQEEGATDNLTPRMNALRNRMLDRCAGLMGVTLAPKLTQPDRMRALINSVYAVTKEAPQVVQSPYQERLRRQQAARAAPLLYDLNRVANWIAVQDDYVRSNPTSERMADSLRRMEVEAFGAARLRGRQRALVRVGEPIRLADYYARYRMDKQGTVACLTGELEQAVQHLLDASAAAK